MKRTPSVDSIAGCVPDRATAIRVRRILDGRDDPRTLPGVARWVAQCYNEPADVELKLEACNELLGTYGTEPLRAEGKRDRYWGDTVAVYCNTGETYASTVLYDVEWDRFYVTSYGDWLETAERARRYTFR